MNVDNDFQIGCSHVVCEDYSLSGMSENDMGAFIIVSDGCSASGDVDFGARLLAMAARETWVKMNSNLFHTKKTDVDYLDFGSQVIQRANVVPPLFPSLDSGVLDATLLMAWVDSGVMKMVMYGDGVFLHKTKDGIHAIHVSFTNNAPSYLSYLLDKNRQAGYIAMGGKKEVTNCMIVDGKVVTSNTTAVSPFEPTTFESAVGPGDVIALCSDGINSFRTAGFTNIEWMDLLEDYIGYKNFDGVFVKRRMAAFKRKCLKEGTTFYDDISIASIVV
jgi:hypothetical protein